jgi:beta-ribofuranosylaminobenzene 5'-phosphate synthase
MPMRSATVTSPCRLSFTLIDLTGASGRKNGMASMVVEDPSFVCTIATSDRMAVDPTPGLDEYRTLILEHLDRLQARLGGSPVRVRVDKPIPTHSGFGSKTNTLLSIGKGYAAVNGIETTTAILAEVAGRAGTSGGTVNLIDAGGFLVDGGHATPHDFAAAPNAYLVPSRYAGAGRRPPVLISKPFPDWPLLMILPAGEHIHGQAELDFFRRTLPIPEAESQRTAHMVLMGLAPAVAEADYGAFCNALNAITFASHFKGKQIELQNDNLRYVVGHARDNGVDAIGMSSMGPVCFSVTRDPERATAWLDGLVERGMVQRYWFTRAANHPAEVVVRTPSMA